MKGSAKYAALFLVTLVATVAFAANGSVVVNFAYEREVGGYVRNAYEVNTPEAMISELTKAVAGMRRLGLTDEMYGAYLPWERTPDVSMAFQYQYIDQLINRTEAVIAWRTLAYSGNTTPETLGDVYEQKMDNLRSFMTEGCSDRWVCTDWIARDVYYVYQATPYYFGSVFGLGAALAMMMSVVAFVYVRVAQSARLSAGRSRVMSWGTDDIRRIRRWIVLPVYVVSFALMALPFLLGAIRP